MHRNRQNRFSFVKAASGLGALLAAVLVVTGCGGSSSLSHSKTQIARATPIQSGADVGFSSAQTGSRSRSGTAAGGASTAPASGPRNHSSSGPPRDDGVTKGSVVLGHGQASVLVRAHPTPATTKDDKTQTAVANTFNPCKLVSVSEAQSITGGAIAGSTEAPLGPTCIYSHKGAARPITMAIEALNFSQITHQLGKRQSVVVHGRKGYCGRLGTSMLFLPLPSGEVLNITAPCGVAQRFATVALSRLAA
jgi:hypothetical protein